ncbi:AHH domain-containing protein [Tsuneonella sp. HG222]
MRTFPKVNRRRLPFRSANRRGAGDYQKDMQRHHILPLQLLSRRCFTRLLDAVGRERIDFDDFRLNGLLLPAAEQAAVKLALPLHRGPHGMYNQLVAERVGQIESDWSRARLKTSEEALEIAHMRLALLQRALRRRLLSDVRRVVLNRHDPLGKGRDFSHLDALVDQLWSATEGETLL